MMKKKTDVLTFEVLRNLFYAVPREMGAVQKRTAYSPHLSEGYDYAGGLSDGDGNLISQAEHVTLHLMAMESGVKAGINKYGIKGIKPGDILAHNDPFTGGSHLPDFNIFKPVFYRDRIIAFSITRAHQTDVGGMRSGYIGDSTEIYQEGIRVPAVKLYEEGKPNIDIFDLILANVRVPVQLKGDFLAMISACNYGEKRIVELVERYGVDIVTEAMKRTIDHSEFRMRQGIQRFPDGTYEFEDYLDGDGGEPINIKVKLQIAGDGIVVDFAGTHKQIFTMPINAPISIAHAGTYLALMGLIDPDIQRNHGCFRPITIKAPEGCIVNAQLPAPVAGGNTETCSRVINTVFGAMAQVVPERIISTEGDGAYNCSMKGVNPDTGKTYANYSSFTGGWSARATKDGLHVKSLRAGDTSNIPTEVLETRNPWRVEEHRLVVDSGGPGKWRGGLSEEWLGHPLEHTPEITTNMSRLDVPPIGVFGGMPGLHTAIRTYRGYKDPHVGGDDLQGDKVDIYSGRIGGVHIAPEDLLYVRSCGGGGYGNPYERDPKLVLEDVLDEYVSPEAAKRDYGVVITSDMQIDSKATEKLRAELKAKNKREKLFVDQATPPYAATPFRQIKMADLPKPIRQHIITTLKKVGHTVTDEK